MQFAFPRQVVASVFEAAPGGMMNEDSTAAVRYLDRGITAIKV